MAHVEELRQIHADINAMETIIKQAEESRRTAQVTWRDWAQGGWAPPPPCARP